MNREETKLMLKRIHRIYPGFEVTPEILDEWARLFRDADGRKVAFKLDKHILNSQFSPKPSELYAKRIGRDPAILEIEAYEKKVADEGGISQVKKDQMEELINKLTEKMTKNDK